VLRGRAVPPPPDEDDLSSVEAYVTYCCDHGVDTFLPGYAQSIARATGTTVKAVMGALKGFGLRVTTNAPRGAVRGFGANDHNIWEGNPGSGGGGGDSLTGFAGREG
jgi:hypothetical protein